MFAWLNLFGKAPEETKWDPKTVSMEFQQPTSPEAPSTMRDSQKTEGEEPTEMQLRGGGEGGVCSARVCYALSAVVRFPEERRTDTIHTPTPPQTLKPRETPKNEARTKKA
ncbi:hypothetical protein N7541_008490 [Penicillium brevicompactum]|uniref:Uncharacterized protein n=1 Tax=Penicillium brevicompactum TaxID=5074 RepID=A0A9W9QZ47_PENBR|nr:hypothetical protein N7541_008490 [Penicillium brevicompactum]